MVITPFARRDASLGGVQTHLPGSLTGCLSLGACDGVIFAFDLLVNGKMAVKYISCVGCVSLVAANQRGLVSLGLDNKCPHQNAEGSRDLRRLPDILRPEPHLGRYVLECLVAFGKETSPGYRPDEDKIASTDARALATEMIDTRVVKPSVNNARFCLRGSSVIMQKSALGNHSDRGDCFGFYNLEAALCVAGEVAGLSRSWRKS